MNPAVLVDAGPLYASADRSDQYHERANREEDLLAAQGIGFAVALTTVVEAHSVILRRLGPARAIDWLDHVNETALVIQPTEEDDKRAIERLQRFPDQAITLSDAILAQLGERLGWPIWTYDHHFDAMRAVVWR